MKCSNPDSGVWPLNSWGLFVCETNPESWVLSHYFSALGSFGSVTAYSPLSLPTSSLLGPSNHDSNKLSLGSKKNPAAFSISLLTRIFTLQLSMEYLHLKGLQPSQARYRPQTEPAWLLTLLSHQNSILMVFPSQQMTLPSTFLSQKFGHHPCHLPLPLPLILSHKSCCF